MSDSSFDAVAIQSPLIPETPTGIFSRSPGFDSRQSQFHGQHPALAGQFPHHNPRNQAILRSLNVSCEACATPQSLQGLHGVINDYANCTEVRYLGSCPECGHVVENVLRVTVEQMTYLRDGEWCTTVRRPWWHCLWPWPIDRDREW